MLFVFVVILLVSSVSSEWPGHSRCTPYSIRQDLPRSLRGATITVVTSNDAPPFVSTIGNSVPFGFDIDLMNLISFMLGINFQYQYVPFLTFIPTVQSDKNTISISTQTITTARMQLVNFAQYFKTGSGFLVLSSYTGTINGLADLCGLTVAVQTGTIQVADVTNQNANCPLHDITIIQTPQYSDVINLVLNGTAVVAVEDQVRLAYTALQSNGQLQVVGTPYNVQPYGILCNKCNEKLCCALVDAINYLIQEGTYQQLLTRYSFTYPSNGVCPSRINLNGTTCSRKCTPSTGICATYLG